MTLDLPSLCGSKCKITLDKLLAIRLDDKEVAVKLVAVIGALGIGALLVLLGLKQKKTREGSAS